MADDPDAARRRFLKIVTCSLGGGIGLAVTAPAIGYVLYPAGRRVVTTSGEPIDVGTVDRVPTDGTPLRVAVVAPLVRDAWTTAQNVALGAAWLRREGDRITAVSGTCPHLGCAVAWKPPAEPGKPGSFACPCHDSAFAPSGDYVSGPAKRGLDPLPISLDNGRLRLTWVQYKPDTPSRDPQ